MLKLSDLQEARAQAVQEMRSLTETAEGESRDLSETEDKRFKGLKGEIATLDRKIERARDLAEAERNAPAVLHTGRGDGRFEERARSFSVIKAIRSAIGDHGVDAGFEREISAETERRIGRKAKGNVLIPDEYFQVERRAFGDNVLNTTGGATLYPETHRGDLFIDTLRNAVIVQRLGATVLDGLVGDQDIPKQTASASVQWLAEDASITDSKATFADVSLSPKRVASIASYTRKLFINAVPSIENIVRNDLVAVIANAIDHAALIGGGSNEPDGVVEQSGVAQVTFATPTWEAVLNFIASVQGANAEIGAMGWAMNSQAVRKLRATLKAEDSAAGYLMDGPNAMGGYPVAVSNALPGQAAGYGSTFCSIPAFAVAMPSG
jgi:HK97 family phage major capsid protein